MVTHIVFTVTINNTHFQIHETEECDDASQIISHLKAFNVSHIGPADRKGLTLSIKNDADSLMGGLIGYTHWDWLFINILWVDESCRGNGLGAKLVSEAETIALKRNCKSVHLDTFEFQAPRFYEKLGFLKFGEIPDCPVKGCVRHFYRKTLDQADGPITRIDK